MSVFSHLPDVGHGRCECGSPLVVAELWTWDASCYASGCPGPNCAMWRHDRSLNASAPNPLALNEVRAARRAYWSALAEMAIPIPPAPLFEALGINASSGAASLAGGA